MSELGRDISVERKAEAAASDLGRAVLGRDLTSDEAAAMSTIFKAAAQALRHGFLNRLAEQVKVEREAETIEEFFENLNPD